MAITAVDRAEWTHHPVTLEFLSMLRESRQETMELWAKQQFETQREHDGALGGIYVLDQMLERVEAMKITDDNGNEIL